MDMFAHKKTENSKFPSFARSNLMKFVTHNWGLGCDVAEAAGGHGEQGLARESHWLNIKFA